MHAFIVPVAPAHLHQFGAAKKYKMVRLSLESGLASGLDAALQPGSSKGRCCGRARVYP